MPYNNSEAITTKEFYNGVSRVMENTANKSVGYKTVATYWEEGFYEFIVRNLYLKGQLRIPMLGSFVLVHHEATVIRQKDANGEMVTYDVPARDTPKFIPSDNFINDVNFLGVTKKYRKRAKNNKLNPNDIRREKRIAEFGAYGSMTQQRIEQEDNNFADLLLQRKTEKEGEADGEN